jgi:hypothetical protein
VSQRDDMVLFYEGQAIQIAGNHDRAAALDQITAMIDGNVNAMIRVQGAEETSKYAFALADRVVGKVRGATMFPARPVPRVAEDVAEAIVGDIEAVIRGPKAAPAAPAPAGLDAPTWRRLLLVTAFCWWLVGVLCGAAVYGFWR